MSKQNGDRARFQKDRKRKLRHRERLHSIMAATQKRTAVPKTVAPAHADHDLHKGAMEDDRPGPERSSHPGLDSNGMPSDAVGIAQDRVGAQADQSQG